MTVIHIILMAPYIQTNNEELYLYNNDVTYYVITCKSAFDWVYAEQWYVITRRTPGVSEILLNKLLEAGVQTSFVHSSIIISTVLYAPYHSSFLYYT